MVMNYLLNGMILQVPPYKLEWSSKLLDPIFQKKSVGNINLLPDFLHQLW